MTYFRLTVEPLGILIVSVEPTLPPAVLLLVPGGRPEETISCVERKEILFSFVIYKIISEIN